jgi:hypothetical protein
MNPALRFVVIPVPGFAGFVIAGALIVAADFAAEPNAPAALKAASGTYVEARTCDVWTGPCFSNSEINLAGDHAVAAWSVEEGRWNGVRLDGLKVVAVIDSKGTLGTAEEGEARAVVFVDDKADASAERALVEMARSLAPRYLKNVVRLERRAVSLTRTGVGEAAVEVASKGGKGAEVKVATVPLGGKSDCVCGNEERAYEPLGKASAVECAKTRAHAFSGEGLGVTWSDPGKRSAMLGRFEI